MKTNRGFTLIELAISLFVITLLLGSILGPLRTYLQNRDANTTQVKLYEVQEALIAYAAVNGRLPCPATLASSGVEVAPCVVPTDGLLPAVTLGLASTGANGAVNDAWGNPIRYAVHNSYTTLAGIQAVWKVNPPPGLKVCSTIAGASATDCAVVVPSVTLAASAPSIVYSTGINGRGPAGSADEAANLDGNVVFVARDRADAGSIATEFDDMLVWTSPFMLFSKMIAVQMLP